MIDAMDDISTFILTPLLGGIDPEFAWRALRYSSGKCGHMFVTAPLTCPFLASKWDTLPEYGLSTLKIANDFDFICFVFHLEISRSC